MWAFSSYLSVYISLVSEYSLVFYSFLDTFNSNRLVTFAFSRVMHHDDVKTASYFSYTFIDEKL